ncbi:MAG TPA: diguanylate cyclase [Nitrospirota bacterium]|nr:diguanylate cyclase [Nitrospirota bacterium]
MSTLSLVAVFLILAGAALLFFAGLRARTKTGHAPQELQQAIAAMKESEERYRQLIELSPDGIAIHIEGRFVFMNPSGMRLLGAADPAKVIGKSVFEFIHPDYHEIVTQRIQGLSRAGAQTAPWLEQKYIRCDGTEIDVEVAGNFFSSGGKPAVQIIFRDISERKQIEEGLRRIALYDDLTGLPNRALFFDRTRQLLELAKRNRFVLAVLYIDLDRFKAVNDALGHEMGDLLLKEVSRRLVACTRKADTVARMGGDEFVGLCGKIEAPEDAAVVARKIIEVLSDPFVLREHECSIGASIGISIYPGDGDDVETLLNRADAAMYRVKDSGRGGFLLYRDMTKP